MHAVGSRCLARTAQALGSRCVGRTAERVTRSASASVSQIQLFSSRAQEERTTGRTKASDRARAKEWAADDQRNNRWRSGGRHQKSRQSYQKRRDKTWQTSDPHEDLCRIKWEPDPETIPDTWFRGHIPDIIKCKMFELWQEDAEKNSAVALGKRFGLRFLDVQAILTMKLSAKEKCDADENYKIYPEIEELMAERKEAFIEDLGKHYGQSIPFVYYHCPDIDKNDPSTWAEPKEFTTVALAESDKNSKFDCPPLQSLDEVAADLKYKRTNKVIYATVRDEEAAELTEQLAEEPKLAKRRWKYALKDTSTKDTARQCLAPRVAVLRRHEDKMREAQFRSNNRHAMYQTSQLVYPATAPLTLRDGDGVMRGATVAEERGMSYADDNLFRRDVRRSSTLREIE